MNPKIGDTVLWRASWKKNKDYGVVTSLPDREYPLYGIMLTDGKRMAAWPSELIVVE